MKLVVYVMKMAASSVSWGGQRARLQTSYAIFALSVTMTSEEVSIEMEKMFAAPALRMKLYMCYDKAIMCLLRRFKKTKLERFVVGEGLIHTTS